MLQVVIEPLNILITGWEKLKFAKREITKKIRTDLKFVFIV